MGLYYVLGWRHFGRIYIFGNNMDLNLLGYEFVCSCGVAISLQQLSLWKSISHPLFRFSWGVPTDLLDVKICIKKCCIAQTQLLGRWWSALVTDLSRVLAASA